MAWGGLRGNPGIWAALLKLGESQAYGVELVTLLHLLYIAMITTIISVISNVLCYMYSGSFLNFMQRQLKAALEKFFLNM